MRAPPTGGAQGGTEGQGAQVLFFYSLVSQPHVRPRPVQAAGCVCCKGKESFLVFYYCISDTRQSSPFSV